MEREDDLGVTSFAESIVSGAVAYLLHRVLSVLLRGLTHNFLTGIFPGRVPGGGFILFSYSSRG